MLEKTEKSTLKQAPVRASYQREDLYPLIDALKMAHISFIADGAPITIPMLCWRVGDDLYIHGNRNSRLIKQLADGCAVCVSFAVLDAWVMAKSAFHHSANYRSAVLFGEFSWVADDALQLAAYADFIEQLEAGRWQAVRQPDSAELAATGLLKMPISEGSVKSRSGGPNEKASDMALPVWHGLLSTDLSSKRAQ